VGDQHVQLLQLGLVQPRAGPLQKVHLHGLPQGEHAGQLGGVERSHHRGVTSGDQQPVPLQPDQQLREGLVADLALLGDPPR
jgi:hypothetical protein